MLQPAPPPLPDDDPATLADQLVESLGRIEGDSPFNESYRAYLTHLQVLAWRAVADGEMDGPGRFRELLVGAEPFVRSHLDEPPIRGRAAAEVAFTRRMLETATQALAERRLEDRFAEERLSKYEREVLRVLAESPAKLRRGEVLAGMQDPPSLARVGQLLAEMFHEGPLGQGPAGFREPDVRSCWGACQSLGGRWTAGCRGRSSGVGRANRDSHSREAPERGGRHGVQGTFPRQLPFDCESPTGELSREGQGA
jgi:hypothetical protein